MFSTHTRLRSSLSHQYGWILKFPGIVFATHTLKKKSKKHNDSYVEHQKSIYGHAMFTDNMDKFSSIRGKIAHEAETPKMFRVLDAATGAGWQALALKKSGYKEVFAIDLVKERIAYCKKVHAKEQITFKVMDMSRLDFPDNFFDVSVVSAALHDLPSDVRLRALSELSRVTKTKVILFEPRVYGHKALQFVSGKLGNFFDESLHFDQYMKDDLIANLHASSLQVLHIIHTWHGLMDIIVCVPNKP